MSMVTKRIGAGAFKQTCLALLDEVAAQHVEVIVTKRGRPVARLVPVQSGKEIEEAMLADLRGKGRMLVEERAFLEPTGEAAGWKPPALE
jgi:prevent-host-death family protein